MLKETYDSAQKDHSREKRSREEGNEDGDKEGDEDCSKESREEGNEEGNEATFRKFVSPGDPRRARGKFAESKKRFFAR